MTNSTDTDSKPSETIRKKHVVETLPDEKVRISILGDDGIVSQELNGEEWFKALEKSKADDHRLMRACDNILSVSGIWAKDRAWVKETGLFRNAGDETITLVVIAEPGEDTVGNHYATSCFGLVLGSVLEVIIEPTLLTGSFEKPSGWTIGYVKKITDADKR